MATGVRHCQWRRPLRHHYKVTGFRFQHTSGIRTPVGNRNIHRISLHQVWHALGRRADGHCEPRPPAEFSCGLRCQEWNVASKSKEIPKCDDQTTIKYRKERNRSSFRKLCVQNWRRWTLCKIIVKFIVTQQLHNRLDSHLSPCYTASRG
jgi:hypothetical protein